MPDKRPSVKDEKQYEALKRKGMSKGRAARIANSPDASPAAAARGPGRAGGRSRAERLLTLGAHYPCHPFAQRSSSMDDEATSNEGSSQETWGRHHNRRRPCR
jgi:hypothetical protein